jgi:glycosyltransferase involved in cell wall biosynthesis
MMDVNGLSMGNPQRAVGASNLRPLRVLFLNGTSRNGGPGRTLFFLLRSLDPRRIERLVVVPREGDVAELLRQGQVADRLTFEPDLIENLVEPWTRPLVRSDFDAPWLTQGVRAAGNVGRAGRALWRLRTLIRRERVGVIFCNGTTANFAGAALAAMTGVPAVWHVFYTSIAPPIAPLHRYLARMDAVRTILCVSQPTRRLFDESAPKVRMVHDAIDTRDFDPDRVGRRLRTELGLRADAIVVASQGRIVRRKGYIELARAVEIAKRRMSPEERDRVRVVVFGDTPEDTRQNHLEECRALVGQLGIADMMSYVGYRPDIRGFVADADVVAVPSVYEDPLPRSVLEAMALGRPVVAFEVGGIPEMVDDGATGLLARGRPPDIEGLANHLLTYVRRPDLRAAHGAAGRARAVREFDSAVHGRRIQQELLDAAGSTAVARGRLTSVQ